MREGYQVYPVVDAVEATSVEAHKAALHRLEQAGAKMISWAQSLCEWSVTGRVRKTAPVLMELFIQTGGTAGIQFSRDKAA